MAGDANASTIGEMLLGIEEDCSAWMVRANGNRSGDDANVVNLHPGTAGGQCSRRELDFRKAHETLVHRVSTVRSALERFAVTARWSDQNAQAYTDAYDRMLEHLSNEYMRGQHQQSPEQLVMIDLFLHTRIFASNLRRLLQDDDVLNLPGMGHFLRRPLELLPFENDGE